MKTKYRLFLVALLYGSYPMPVMFSYCLIGSYLRGWFFRFIQNERPLPPWLSPEELVCMDVPLEDESLSCGRAVLLTFL